MHSCGMVQNCTTVQWYDLLHVQLPYACTQQAYEVLYNFICVCELMWCHDFFSVLISVQFFIKNRIKCHILNNFYGFLLGSLSLSLSVQLIDELVKELEILRSEGQSEIARHASLMRSPSIQDLPSRFGELQMEVQQLRKVRIRQTAREVFHKEFKLDLTHSEQRPQIFISKRK